MNSRLDAGCSGPDTAVAADTPQAADSEPGVEESAREPCRADHHHVGGSVLGVLLGAGPDLVSLQLEYWGAAALISVVNDF